MERIQEFLRRFMRWANRREDLAAAVLIGSQARDDHPADEFSDLDLILIVEDAQNFLQSDAWLEAFGTRRVSFVEDTLYGLKEVRLLLDDALDADFILLPRPALGEALAGGALTRILSRGYRVLADKIQFAASLAAPPPGQSPPSPPTQTEFCNLVSDFWYHAVWSAKKLLRGELWTAIFCVDGYMKRLLLTVLEYTARVDKDTENIWHEGRFLEEWADKRYVEQLSKCFARYEKTDIKAALFATMELFRAAARAAAQALGMCYPQEADKFCSDWVQRALDSAV